jgi:hypothetical protein
MRFTSSVVVNRVVFNKVSIKEDFGGVKPSPNRAAQEFVRIANFESDTEGRLIIR